ncbi:MAG: N-acetyltransferase family protein [Bacteroidota bacterium]
MRHSDQPSIDLARAEDYQAIADIYNVFIQGGESTMEEDIHTRAHIEGWVKKFNERERLFVLKKEGQVIGWAIIKRYSDRKGYRFAAETAVYLHPDALGKGYGSYLKTYVIGQCRELGYHHLVAKIFATNDISIEYNRKLGYTIVGRQKEIGFKNGHWQDVVIMQLVL